MKKYKLQATKRELFGRKVKKIRREGLLPATVYGKKIKSASLAVDQSAFAKVYADAGETGLVELNLGSEIRPVLIHNVQIDPVDSAPLHVEFFQVDLKEKVRTKVPLVFVGESPAVAQKQGVLLTVLDEVEVEALPTQLPEKIEVDVSGLTQVNQEFKVNQLSVPAEVTLLTEGELTVVKIGALVSREAEAEAAAEAAAAAAAAPAGEVPAEGEKVTPEAPTEKPSEEKPEEASK